MKIFKICILVFLTGLLAETAFALDMEFYTYGGFHPVVQAFKKIALIFSDNEYKGLVTVIAILGVLVAGIGWAFKCATGANLAPLTWTVPVLVGLVTYVALFIPTGNISIYDPTLNRMEIVSNVPDAIVATAGFLNKIEKGLVDIIETSAAPGVSYSNNAGGVGFKVLEALRTTNPRDDYARTSMIRYIKDCVTFELMRPGTELSLDNFRNQSTDFVNELGKAYNPAIYTVYYDSAKPEGTSLTCTEAWNRLQPLYSNPSNYDESIKRVCSLAHFDSSSPAELNRCKSLISETFQHVTGQNESAVRLIQQRQIAEILYHFYFLDDYQTSLLMEADRKITSTGIGIGITMNEWIPIIRAIMTAIAIGSLPLLVLFLPTPVVGRAASVMFGFFVFLTTWGITDAVIHGAAMDYASYSFEDVRQSNLGVYAMAAFPNLSMKMLAMFGVIRSAGIMLASIFSMMLVKFGGSALAHFATNLNSLARGAGAEAGQLLTPEGNAAVMTEQARIAGLLEGMQEHRFTNMAAAGAYKMHKEVGGYHAAMNTRNGLQDSGHLPQGTTAAEYAQAEASAGRSVGTNGGVVSATTGTDGNISRMKGETVNADGSTTTTITGAGGTGQALDTMPAGTAKYDVDGGGHQSLTYAQVNGMNPISIGQSLQNQLIGSASKTLGGSTNWNLITRQMQKDSLTSTTAQSYSERLDNSIRSNWQRSFNDTSSFVHSMDQRQQTQFSGAVSGGILDIGFSGKGQITVVGNDGEKVSFNVSEQTAQAFARDQAKVRAESIQNTFTGSQGLDYLTDISKQIGASESYSFLEDARKVEAATQSYGSNMQTAFVLDFATNNFGNDSPESIRKTISSLAHMAQSEPQTLNRMVEGFVDGNGYGWGRTTDQVNSSMDAMQNRAHDDAALKGAVNHATHAASQKASGVTPDTLVPTDQKGLHEPNPETNVDKADHLRGTNRHNESGNGRIQTTPAGMAKEGVGKVFSGVVDSQGDRPTDKGYWDYAGTTRKVDNAHPIGPVPKDTPSTLGGKR